MLGAEYAWGDEFVPGGAHRANIWQGPFPFENRCDDGYERTSPVSTYAPNGYGVFDMIGNVWEWTSDWWAPKHRADATKACCIPQNPRGGSEHDSHDPSLPLSRIPRKVIKDGPNAKTALSYASKLRPSYDAQGGHPIH